MTDLICQVEKLRQELRERRGSFHEIAAKSGTTYHWLVAFSQGKISNPTIKNIAALSSAMSDGDRHDR